MKRAILWLIPCLLFVCPNIYSNNDLITGKICMVGNEPFTQLVCQTNNSQYILTGDLLSELKQFQGFELKLTGKVIEQSPNFKTEFNVLEYQPLIYDQNGILADTEVGYIISKINELYLETVTGKRFKLKGKLLRELKKYNGLKLWVSGKLSKKRLFGNSIFTVDSYGVIRSNSSRIME